MKRFLRNIVLVFSPCIILLTWYIIDDPFMMYWHYDNLYEYGQRKICANDAYRGIRWMKQYDDSMHYNSFILGSSRSDFYYIDDWKQYLDSSAVCFHFNQSGDNLLGTYQRVKYLFNKFDTISNILFIMDYKFLEDITTHKGHLFRQPWQVTEQWDFFTFNFECVKAFYSVDYQMSNGGGGKKLEYYYIPSHNELHKIGAEHLLESDPETYYNMLDNDYKLYDRNYSDSVANPVIHDKQKEILVQLHKLLLENKTEYKIIISPLYDQIALNKQDLKILNSIYGEENVFDFSGVNEYTNDITNYYECSHYRPKLCKQILKLIYD